MSTAIRIRRHRLLHPLVAVAVCAMIAMAQQGCAPKPSPAVKVNLPPAQVGLTVTVDQPGVKISPTLYGLMTEEINYSYDGGLYGELIQNRVFQNVIPPPRGGRGNRRATTAATAPAPIAAPITRPAIPLHWSMVASDGAAGKIAADDTDPVNTTALKTSLRLDITSVQGDQRVGIANDGYWGIPVKPNTSYRASFYAKGAPDFSGPLTVDIESNDGSTIYATASIPKIDANWQHYTVMLATGQVEPTAATRFVISAQSPGSVWFSLVSLFPPTFKDRPNGNRADIMQILADMHPAFLRFPGGNYLEGNTIAERFNWKETIHDLDQRPGHMSPWGYRSTDGMGLLEFLEWCQDLNMEPVLAVYAGYSLRGEKVVGADLQPFVQDALDEIEYVTGDASTPWGSERAKDGHFEPFKLTYVEIGNEDNLERTRPNTYGQRFAQFYDAIKAKYPSLQLIATTTVRTRKPDVVDDHFYRSVAQMEGMSHHYDLTDRNGPKIFVGEWATREGRPTPNMNAALADASWLTGLERNSDIVIMSCYAPLFVNVNPNGMQWPTDLIGYDTLNSFGSPSYYVQKMFIENRGDRVLPIRISPQSIAGPTTQPAGGIFAAASAMDSGGQVILKVVNTHAIAQQLQIVLNGVTEVDKQASGEILTGEPSDMNSVAQPQKIVPQPITITDAAPSFVHEFPAHSVSVIRFQTR